MEAAAGAGGTPEPTLANLLKESMKHQRETAKFQREIAKATKGFKQPQPRKASDSQRRWQAFQHFIHAKLQKNNPNAPFKNAMNASGQLWEAGNPKTKEMAAEFEEYLKEHPIPSAEEVMAAHQEKLEAIAGVAANRLAQRQLSSLTYFEKTLLTKMNEINDNVTRLIETLSPIEGGYRNNTRKHIRKNNMSRKQYK